MRRFARPLLCALLIAVSLGRAQAQEAAIVSIEPASQAVEPGQASFTVSVMVDNVTGPQGLGGYTLVMAYDPAVVRATMVTDSGFVQSTGNAVVCPASAIDDEEGRLAHVCFTIPVLPELGPQVTEPQALATITFEPVGEGASTLDLTETTIVDPQGNTLEATTVPGRVTVGDGQDVATSAGDSEAAAEETGGGGNTGLYVGIGVAALVAVAVIGSGLALWTRRRATR